MLRAVREMTTWQLVTDPTLAAPQEPFTGGAARAVRIKRELNNRAVLVLIPVVLLWLRWDAAGAARRRWSPLPAAAVTAIAAAVYVFASFLGFQLELEWDLAPGTGQWLPVVAFAAWGLTSRYWRVAGSSINTTSE